MHYWDNCYGSLFRSRYLGCHATLSGGGEHCVTNQITAAKETTVMANVRDLQNTCLSSTVCDVGMSSSITSALPCSTTNRVPP